MHFKEWLKLLEVGASGGVGGGMEPTPEAPLGTAKALNDLHAGPNNRELPPTDEQNKRTRSKLRRPNKVKFT